MNNELINARLKFFWEAIGNNLDYLTKTLHPYLLKVTGNNLPQEKIQDLVNEVIVSIHKKFQSDKYPNITHEIELCSLIVVATKFQYLKELRNEKKEGVKFGFDILNFEEALFSELAYDPDNETEDEDDDCTIEVLDCLNTKVPHSEAALFLKYYQTDITYKDLANEFGITKEMINPSVKKTIRTIKEHLGLKTEPKKLVTRFIDTAPYLVSKEDLKLISDLSDSELDEIREKLNEGYSQKEIAYIYNIRLGDLRNFLTPKVALKKGGTKKEYKITLKEINEIQTKRKEGCTIQDIANEYNINTYYASRVCKGVIKQAKPKVVKEKKVKPKKVKVSNVTPPVEPYIKTEIRNERLAGVPIRDLMVKYKISKPVAYRICKGIDVRTRKICNKTREQVIKMRLDGMTIQGIADELNISLGSVNKILQKNMAQN